MTKASGGSAILLAALLLAVALTGCLGATDQPQDEPVSPASQGDGSEVTIEEGLWNGTTRLPVVDHTAEVGYEADVLCAFGGGPQLPRTDEVIPPGTSHLELTVGIDDTSTGYQVGYVVDGSDADHATGEEKEITWLPSVPPGQEETFTVEVTADQVETDETRWSFYYQLNPGVEELCYTGALVEGERWVTAQAIRG